MDPCAEQDSAWHGCDAVEIIGEKMNEEDLRDCFAMFALVGMVMNGNRPFETMHKEAYMHADAMLEARQPQEEVGIAAIKRTRRKV